MGRPGICWIFILCPIWPVVGIVNGLAEEPVTAEDVQRLIRKYTDIWNRDRKNVPLWVISAEPGDAIAIPGITFGTSDKPKAGMNISVHAHLIVLNRKMVPESLLSTFFHEYGHAKYTVTHRRHPDEIASEAEAVRFSLEALASEGYPNLAYREADNVQHMAKEEPYKSALARLANDPLWRKYAHVSGQN
jgi:hypothetical protein